MIINNPDIHAYAAKRTLQVVQELSCHENAVKIAAYVLGELGDLIVEEAKCSPLEQFHALHREFSSFSRETRVLLLSSYLKLVNLFPEIKAPVLALFAHLCNVLDMEVQQRACEYFAILSMPTDALLQAICEQMPPFPQRESALLKQLNRAHADVEDKRTWVQFCPSAHSPHL